MSTDKNKAIVKDKDSVKAYRLTIPLRDITPRIWRRLLVKSDKTIAEIYCILQTVRG